MSLSRVIVFFGFSALMLQSGMAEPLFRHSTLADFKSSTLSNSGQNLYIKDDGSVRLIHQQDFNGDGYPDILVLNDHNHFDTPPAVLYHQQPEGGFKSLMPPLWKDMPLYQVLEHYAERKKEETFLPALSGVSGAVGDFNGDGYPDIAVSNFVHGWNLETFPLSIYWGSKDGYKPESRHLLDGYFAGGITSADLDGDGIQDLVIACRGPEYEAVANQKLPVAERKEKASEFASKSWVVFGSKSWQEAPRRVAFNTLYAIDAAVADLSGNGKPALVFLEAGTPGAVRIYADPTASPQKEAQVIEVGDCVWDVIRSRKIHIADLNDDGAPDILVPETAGLRILWNDGKGNFAADRYTLLDIPESYAAATGDFNGDGRRDLVVAVGDSSSSQLPSVALINRGGPVETWERVSLPTRVANAVVVKDLDGDGYDDIVFANYQDSHEESVDTDSYVYPGGPRGVEAARRIDLATFGAVDVKVVPSASGRDDLLFINRQSGKRGVASTGATDSGGMPSYVYWGNAAASYSPASMSRFAAPTSETAGAAVDLEGTGKANLVLLTHRGRKVGIYTLDKGEYKLLMNWDLPARGKTPLVADFDKDGRLDLLVMGGETAEAWLYRDVMSSHDHPETIPLPAVGYSAALGDLDNDGHLDLINAGVGNVFVVYGNERGLDPKRTLLLPQDKFFAKVALADLDKDGKLDVVAFGWNERSTGNNRTDSLIFWNRDGKIDNAETSPLPTLGGASQGSIADVNGDGYLDIISSNYHGGDDRHLDVQVFLGDGSRTFTRERSWTVPGFSSAANQVADFNKDGFMDLLVFNHSESTELVEGKLRGGKHSTGAMLYWGDKNGFSIKRRSWIPTYGPHNKLNVDAGDLMSRSGEETLTSAAIPLPAKKGACQFTLKVGILPASTGSLKAKLIVAGKGGEERTIELPLRPAGEGDGKTLVFGPATLTTAVSVRYQIILNHEHLGVAPVIREVAGELQ